MRSMRQRLAAATLLAGLTTLGLGLATGPAGASALDYCPDIIGEAANGSLEITTTPDEGSDVDAGDEIAVDASWDDGDFEETDRLVLCVTVDGEYDDAASSQHKSLDNDGEFSAAATVPADAEPGSEVCIVAGVKGQYTDGDPSQMMVSEERCFRTAAAVQPKVEETTTTTTTVPVEVEPQVIEAGDPAPVLEMAPAVAPAPMPVLPRTGAGIDLLAGFGGIALALGGVTRFLGRRRPSEG